MFDGDIALRLSIDRVQPGMGEKCSQPVDNCLRPRKVLLPKTCVECIKSVLDIKITALKNTVIITLAVHYFINNAIVD